MFVTPENPGEAVSAVKALSKAAAAGQRIYHITQANQASTLPNIHHDSLTMSEIQAGLAVGKEVLVHTDSISVPGWTGVGYIIFDPVTGDGAYKIGGGFNGSNSKEVGFLDFSHAVMDQPGLLIPTCAMPFFEQAAANFIETNKAIFGLTAPVGLSILTAGSVAESVGGFTILKAVKLSFKNPSFLLGNLRAALLVSLINYFIVSLAFELGVFLGSAASAALCRKNT